MQRGQSEDDESLFQAWSGGDKAAADTLVRRYVTELRRYFGNKVATVEDANDLMQITFEACTKSAAKFRGESSFRTFLYKLASNKLKDYYAKQSRQPQLANIDELSVADLCPGPTTVRSRNRREMLLLEGLRRLPIKDQELLEFRYWQKMKIAEIAEILEIGENAVKSRIRRAKERLDEIIQQLEDEL